jgi:integrase
MRRMMGVIKDRHGTYYARRKVPDVLQEATASVLGVSKSRQVWLKKSLGTKDLKTANVRAKPVEMAFDRTLADAAALIKERPLRTTLAQTEIDRIAEYHFATTLAYDEEERREGTGNEELVASIAQQLTANGVEFDMPFPLAARPPYGLSDREVAKRRADLAWLLPIMQEALARGDISKVSEHLQELLHVFQISLDPKSEAYRKLGMAVLQADVTALRAIGRRERGEPIATPSVPDIPSSPGLDPAGDGLRAAFEGWKKAKTRPQRTVDEYGRSLELFIQLHGDVPILQMKRRHAREFREALQEVPRSRKGPLLAARLPELREWGRSHPEVPKITAGTINKQLGAVQAVAVWARDHGIIPDDAPWADPFSNMRLPEDDPDREPFTMAELQLCFSSPVFAKGQRPQGGRGEAAFWLPLLGLLTGARQSELAGLSVADVRTDDTSGVTAIFITKDRERGKRVKTRQSERAVPIHPELVKLGFRDYVQSVRQTRGADAWLFPLVAPDTQGVRAWSKWFGRYIRSIGIGDKAKVFHSFRHNFKDALRAAGIGQEVHDAITGHSMRGDVSRGYGAKDMATRFGWTTLANAVAKVTYPGLDLSPAKRGRVKKAQSKSK